MQDFFVKVSLDYGYAREHIEELGECFKLIQRELPENLNAELLRIRFTFGSYKMTAETRGECIEAAEAAWRAVNGGDEPKIRIIAVPYAADDEKCKLTTDIFNSYFGVEEYNRLIAELYAEIPILAENGSLSALRMRNYLFAVDPGNGFSTVLSCFGSFLRRMGVYGDETEKRSQYAELVAANEDGGGRFSVDDLISKFADDYLDDCNVVGIDISYFMDGEKYDDLRNFLHRLYKFRDKAVFVFRVPFLEKKALDKIAAILDDVMTTRVIQIPPMHESALAEHFWDATRRLGVNPDNTVLEPFFMRVIKEKSDGRFYGFKTVEKIANEMVLAKAARDAERKALGEEPVTDILTADDVPGEYTRTKESKNGYDELSELIGMEQIAGRVREIAAQVKLALKNEQLDKPCIHMRFLGHPGTGKTTVARIIGRIFREEGILRKGAFLEYSARQLCAEYVGQTAVRTASICRDAYGSVLFIDEAYALYENDFQSNDYGKEALTTLISEMENHRDDMLVIMAGYTEDMETLMRGNAGLRSRMPYVINFPNYTKSQLFEIFMLMVRRHFSYTEQFEQEARNYFDALSDEYIASKEFANARFVRNLYERTWSKGALRAALNGSESFVLTKEDLLAAKAEKEFSEKLSQEKARIGF